MLLRPLLSLASHNSYGYGICMRDVRHAAGQRAAQFAADKGEWDWHPVAIERALHFDHTLSVAPVCVSCFATFEEWDGAGDRACADSLGGDWCLSVRAQSVRSAVGYMSSVCGLHAM